MLRRSIVFGRRDARPQLQWRCCKRNNSVFASHIIWAAEGYYGPIARLGNDQDSVALELELDEVERFRLELDVVDLAVGTARIVDLPDAVVGPEPAPRDKSHLIQLGGDGCRIVVARIVACVMPCARWQRKCDRDTGDRETISCLMRNSEHVFTPFSYCAPMRPPIRYRRAHGPKRI